MLLSMKIVEATVGGLQIRLEFLLNTRDGTMLILKENLPRDFSTDQLAITAYHSWYSTCLQQNGMHDWKFWSCDSQLTRDWFSSYHNNKIIKMFIVTNGIPLPWQPTATNFDGNSCITCPSEDYPKDNRSCSSYCEFWSTPILENHHHDPTSHQP